MKFKIGDFVRFVDEQGEGYITSIINEDLVGVTDLDGFEVPVPASKVTSVYGRMNEEEKEAKVTATTVVEGPFVSEGLLLAITGDQRQGLVEFFLINESSYEVLFSFNSLKSDQVKGEKRGVLGPKGLEKIYTANASTVGNWPVFTFQFLFHSSILRDIKKPLVMEKRIRPADLSAPKKNVPLLDVKAWTFRLDQPKPDLNTDKLKEHFFSHRPGKKNR